MVPLLSFILQRLTIFIIRIYQLVISKIIWPYCRFQPTCSQYGIEALCKFGIAKGSWLTIKRVFKCHPLNSGGEDPVPPGPCDTR